MYREMEGRGVRERERQGDGETEEGGKEGGKERRLFF